MEAKKLKIIILPSEFEALLLEANLIKQFQPLITPSSKTTSAIFTLKSPAKISAGGGGASPNPHAELLALILRPKQSGFFAEIRRIFPIAPAEFYLKNHAFITRLIFAPPLALIKTKNQPLPIAGKLAKLKNCSKAKADV